MRNWLSLNRRFRSWLLVNLCLFFLFGQAQIANYVSNGSFESLNSYSATSLYNVVNYWQPIDTGKGCDYLATLLPPFKNAPYALGFQYPRTGNNYVLIQLFHVTRSYPRNRLKQPLKAGTTYCVKFYVVNTNHTPHAIGSFGAYFGGSTLDTITQCNVALTYLQPQVEHPKQPIITDTLNWVPITGTFVAQGHEKYMVIGNFRSDADTDTLLINPTYLPSIGNVVCLDDVSVIPLDLPAYAGRDTAVFPGDSVFLGRTPDVGIDEACVWYQLPSTTPIDTVAGFWVKPNNNVSYAVRQEVCGVVRWDTVHVYMDGVGIEKHNRMNGALKLYPNPTDGLINIVGHRPNSTGNYTIFDSSGRLVASGTITDKNSELQLQTHIPPGLYTFCLSYEPAYTYYKKLVITQQAP